MLTGKQTTFAHGVAILGLSHTEAYRQAYDAGNMKPETIRNEAWLVAKDPEVATMVKELRDGTQAQNEVSRADIIKGFKGIDDNGAKDSDRLTAFDKLAKILGMYQREERDAPVKVTLVTVILDRGGKTVTETHQVERPEAIEGEVIDAV